MPPFAGRKAAARCAGTMRPSQIHLSHIRLVGLVTAIMLLCGPAWAHERPTTTPAARFLQAHEEGAAPKIRLAATHQATLAIVPLQVLQENAI